MNRSTHPRPNVVPRMTNPEVALRASHDLLLETANNDIYYNVPISAWEAVLNKEHPRIAAGVATAVQDEALVKFERHQIESWGTENEDVIAREVKSTVK